MQEREGEGDGKEVLPKYRKERLEIIKWKKYKIDNVWIKSVKERREEAKEREWKGEKERERVAK